MWIRPFIVELFMYETSHLGFTDNQQEYLIDIKIKPITLPA